MSEILPFDLKAELGDPWRVSWSQEAKVHRSQDPWYREIRCRQGTICPWGPETLAFTAVGKRPTMRKLLALGCSLVQDGDKEWTVTFSPDLFEQVAQVVAPRKRRKLSPEQRAKQVATLAAFRFPQVRGHFGV